MRGSWEAMIRKKMVRNQMLPWLLLLPMVTGADFTCEGPDDLGVQWPSNSVLEDFGNTIDGDIYLEGSSMYTSGSKMKNLVYNSKFGAIVYPESTDDVKKAILFAKEHGLRPTIYSSGHDYMGRSSGDGTFQINLSKMVQLDVNGADSDSPTGKSLTVGTGLPWIDIYKEVDKDDLIAVGGSAKTVSPGGYTLGGGHSPVTRMLGLGVDSVLEFTMVTADGSIVTVDEVGGTVGKPNGATEALNDNGDLWWSVLGGGGGVYGVVTEFKYKLHEPPADGFVRFAVTFVIHKYTNCVGVAAEALKRFFQLLRDDELSNNWGGYLLISSVSAHDPEAGNYLGGMTLFMNRWGGDVATARAEISAIADYRRDCQFTNDFTHYDSFLDYEQTTNDPIYIRTYVINTLLQEEDLEDDNGLVDLLMSLDTVPTVDVMVCTGTMLGGAGNVPSHDAKSVSPDFRTAKMSLSCGAGGWDENLDDAAASAIEDFGKKLYQYGTGVYYNEGAYFLENWKTEYWKTMARYNRLLRVKQEWDPDNLFWCRWCVGSDLVTHQSDKECPTHFTLLSAAPRTTPAALSLAMIWIAMKIF